MSPGISVRPPPSNTVAVAVALLFHGVGSATWQPAFALTCPTDFFDDCFKLTQNKMGAYSSIAGFAKATTHRRWRRWCWHATSSWVAR